MRNFEHTSLDAGGVETLGVVPEGGMAVERIGGDENVAAAGEQVPRQRVGLEHPRLRHGAAVRPDHRRVI